MSKKYAILAAGLVASGRTASMTSILERGFDEPNPKPVAGDKPLWDAIDLAVAEFGRDPRSTGFGPAAGRKATIL